MALKEPAFTIGIEEEYLIVDRQSRDLVRAAPQGVMAMCEKALGAQVTHEFMQSQIEVGTKVCKTIKDARENLAFLRKTVADACTAHGLAPIAASTHPFADWRLQQHTDQARYKQLAHDMQIAVRRLVICGMHVHLGIEDEDLRIDLMGQLSYFLPHLLALSTSSPFWGGEVTGLKSFRLCIFNELPRTGPPTRFASWAEYQRTVDVLTGAGLIEDATKIWWDLRPSARFPTLEMRVTDISTRLDDGIAIAALYVCLARALYRLRRQNQRWREYSSVLIEENRWRAQRYGMDAGLVDFGKGRVVPYADLVEELLDITREDAEALGCTAEAERARRIVQEGSSADRQLAVYRLAKDDGADEAEALRAVVDHLIAETVEGL